MKKIIITSVCVLMCSMTFVSAQTDDISTSKNETRPLKRDDVRKVIQQKREDLKIDIQEKREEVRAQIEERQAERRIKLQEKAQERVKMILGKMFDRFDAVIVRFEGFLDRIESRIAKMQEKGIDTSKVEELFETAQEKVNDSAALIIATKAELESLIAGESSKEAIKGSIEKVKTSLKSAHTALKDVVVEIKSSDKIEDETEDEDEESEENTEE